jgi:excinuclease UvrABC ATPase subunit
MERGRLARLPPRASRPGIRRLSMAEGTNGWLILRGCKGNNLQAIDVAIPRGLFTCVTGVSGSGKSTLIQDTLFPRLMYEVYGTRTV